MTNPERTLTLQQLAEAIDARLVGGDADTVITGVATLDQAGSEQVSFFTNPRYRRLLGDTLAAAVITGERDREHCPVPVLVSTNPLLAYAKTAVLFRHRETVKTGVHPSAWVDPQARIAEDAWIGPHCSIDADAVIGAGSWIGPHTVIETGAEIGDHCRLIARVTVGHHVRLGQRVTVQPGAVIGSEGFGLANDRGRWVNIPQLGSVRIGNDVDIGANTTIDRGALEDTVIEDGVKLDNLIQVGHNVTIGAHSALAGCVGIAGSARIGRHCSLGGGVGVAGHLEIADGVQVTGMSLVARSIREPGVYSSGLSVEPNRIWNRISARLRRIDDLARRLIEIDNKTAR